MFRNKTFLFSISTFSCLLTFPLFAMEEGKELACFHPPAISQKAAVEESPCVKAQVRLDFIKERVDEIPHLNMLTQLPELWDLYEKDVKFIESQLSKRPHNPELLIDAFKRYGEKIKEEFSGQNLSLFDSAAIGRDWSLILSANGKGEIRQRLPQQLAKSREEQQRVKKGFAEGEELSAADELGGLISSPSLFLPQVSCTGLVDVSTLNEAGGCLTPKHNKLAVDFLAVGTNMFLSFDEFKDQTSYKGWFHDWGHSYGAGHLGNKNIEAFLKERDHRIVLRQAIEAKEEGTPRNQLELACFYYFHEQFYKSDLKSLKVALEELDKTYKRGPTYVTEFSDMSKDKEIYKSYIKAAENLHLACKGETFAQQYEMFWQHLLEGFKSLKAHGEKNWEEPEAL